MVRNFAYRIEPKVLGLAYVSGGVDVEGETFFVGSLRSSWANGLVK